MEYVTSNQTQMPALGLGTYRLKGDACTETVSHALDMGYRHIDTAEFYNNQTPIRKALADTPIDRDDLFVTTKVWRTNLGYDDVLQSARQSLEKLGLDTVDLLLIHWPSRSVPLEETIEAMNELQSAGDVDHIGVSNFSVDQLQRACDLSETPILTNQVEYNPYTDQADVLEYCLENEVILTAYSPLAKGKVSDDETLTKIAERYGKTPTQVTLRWLLQQKQVAAIPKASSPEHLQANLEVVDFELTGEEMTEIFDLQGGLLTKLQRALGL